MNLRDDLEQIPSSNQSPKAQNRPSKRIHFNMLHLRLSTSKWCTPLWSCLCNSGDRSPKSLIFHTSLNQPCREVDKGQLGFLDSNHTHPHTPFSYINTPISPFQRTRKISQNPRQNYKQISLKKSDRKSFLRIWLFS